MSDARHPSFPSGAGGVWFGPALAVVIAVLLIWKSFESASPPEEVVVASGPHLAGTMELETGSRMRVSLDPLHEDARRQEFDGLALARQLGLPQGEPWRLSLEAVGDAPEAELEGVQVMDGEGACMAPILDGVSAAEGSVQDPLLGLFHPQGPSGETPRWEVVLWGRPPGAGGRLECSWGSVSLLPEAGEAVSGPKGAEDTTDPVVHPPHSTGESRE